ncbi:MAG: polyprenyl synthetase family protein [Clostridia bacterium]|nr:polyprenyl synthetase family protein [Clostridia bacterium]
MKHQVMDLFYPQLNLIEGHLKQEFKLRSGSVFDYIAINSASPLDYYLPAILVLVFGNDRQDISKKLIQLSCVAQFIYLGTMVHSDVAEENEANLHYPILIGDYLYGKFFVSLCNANSLEFLESLSRAIKYIHEARVEESHCSDPDMDKTKMLAHYNKKWGEYFGVCCQIGASLNNNMVNCHETAYGIGRLLGEFYGTICSKCNNINLINEAKGNLMLSARGIVDPVVKQNFITLVENLYWKGSKEKEKSILVG